MKACSVTRTRCMFTGAYSYTGYTAAPCCGGGLPGWPTRYESFLDAVIQGLASDGTRQPMTVQRFESARYQPGQGELFTVYPFVPSTISVATGALYTSVPAPVSAQTPGAASRGSVLAAVNAPAAPARSYGESLAAAATVAASKGVSVAKAPAGLDVGTCGYKCVGPSKSALPPSGFTAWADTIYRVNAGNAALWAPNF